MRCATVEKWCADYVGDEVRSVKERVEILLLVNLVNVNYALERSRIIDTKPQLFKKPIARWHLYGEFDSGSE